ncbi:MAG: restriction endonuclease subunit S [Erysipelotrichales bacterium]|nr:restriction endonuclease subunit S [Erysipelotrichales bacterium]
MIKVKLDDICMAQSSNLMQKNLEKISGNHPIYGASGLIKTVDFYKQEKPYIGIVKDGAGVGRVMLLPAQSSIISTMQYLLPKENIHLNYLFYALQYFDLGKKFTGATIPHIYFKDYKNRELWLPTLPEQQRIAAELDAVCSILAKQKQQYKFLGELVKSKFNEMFGCPVANDMGWAMNKIEPELGKLDRGVSKHRPRNAPELLGGEYPLIQTGEVASAELYITEHKATYSEIGLKQSKVWKKGTLCITIAANIAKTAILGFDACFPDSIVGFTANEKTNSIFMHYWFSFFQKMLEEQAPESAQKNINLQILRELNVITPPIDLQKEFATFVTQTEQAKATLKTQLNQTETLYKALMQKYFEDEGGQE